MNQRIFSKPIGRVCAVLGALTALPIAIAGLVPGCDDCGGPQAKLVVTVSPAECQACNRIAVIAQSPQITAAIQAGQSPCAEELTGGPPGCVMGIIWLDTWGACGSSTCGPYTVDLASEFAPAVSGATASITDTVAFCPFDFDGTNYNPVGNCVSSFNQCDSSTTIAMYVDGTIGGGGTGTGGGGGVLPNGCPAAAPLDCGNGRCCTSGHPYDCPAQGNCHATTAGAAAECGTYATCH